jgi:hypothetical protein
MGEPLRRQCLCGADFLVPLNSRGLPTTRRYCDACRVEDSRARDRRLRARIPASVSRCSSCHCLTDPALGGARPSPEPGLCLPCYEWASRARARALASHNNNKIPLYRPPYWAGGIAAILDRHGLDWGLLLTGSRVAHVVAARAEVAAWLRSLGQTVEAIGRRLHRARTTVMYLLDTWDIAHGQPATLILRHPARTAGAALHLEAM